MRHHSKIEEKPYNYIIWWCYCCWCEWELDSNRALSFVDIVVAVLDPRSLRRGTHSRYVYTKWLDDMWCGVVAWPQLCARAKNTKCMPIWYARPCVSICIRNATILQSNTLSFTFFIILFPSFCRFNSLFFCSESRACVCKRARSRTFTRPCVCVCMPVDTHSVSFIQFVFRAVWLFYSFM